MDSATKALILSTVQKQYHDAVNSLMDNETICTVVFNLFEEFWTNEQKLQAKKDFENRVTDSPYYKVFVQCYGTQRHFDIVDSHRGFLAKAYQRLRDYFPLVTKKQIDEHDLSKYSIEQTIGYTARWVHHSELDNPAWQRSLKYHYDTEPHHPEFHYSRGDEMPDTFLQESVLDMVASRWERNLQGRDVTNFDLVNFDSLFLSRYSAPDLIKVEELIQSVKSSSDT